MPYVGVTGFTSRAQIEAALTAVPTTSSHKLMTGVLMSYKSAFGMLVGNPYRYPERALVKNLWVNDSRVLSAIHYNGPNDATLYTQLEVALRWAGPQCQGIQLNIAWPAPGVLEKLAQSRPELKVILQIGAKASRILGDQPDVIAKRTRSMYAGLVDYVLIDPSCGTGKDFSAVAAIRLLSALEDALRGHVMPPELAVAGGLEARNLLAKISPLLDERPELSWDAEGRLRNDFDELDMTKTLDYIRASYTIIAGRVPDSP